jgi:hypothetical protein
MKILNYILGAGLGTLLITSCGDKHETEEHKDETPELTIPKDTTPVTVNEETKLKFDFAIANIPSPVETINEISNWGIEYDNSLLNDPKKSGTYKEEFIKAVNLGIYNIDMAYAMVNDKGQDVLKYMKGTMSQAEALGLRGAIDQMVGKRAEQNLSNKDSLLKILDQIFVKSDEYLRTNERVFTATSVFAGSWVEGLYLTCKIAQKATDAAVKEKAYKHLWDQRFYLKNLIDLLEDYKDKKEAVTLNNDFKAIHSEIEVIKDPKDLKDTQFTSISGKIIALRERLTK